MRQNKTIQLFVLDDDVSSKLETNLKEALSSIQLEELKNLEIEVLGFATSEELISALESKKWRNVKAILIDWELRQPENEAEWQDVFGADLVDIIITKNPSIKIFGISAHDPQSSRNRNNLNFKRFRKHPNVKDDFIWKDKILKGGRDATSVLTRIFRDMLSDIETPFFDKFEKYVKRSSNSWHVPGHNRGEALKNSVYAKHFYDFFGERTFTADHDIPKTFGSIFAKGSAKNIIGVTQRKVANTFDTGQTFFVTNGNSSANNIILMSLLKPDDPVLVSRSCHKSIHYAMIMSGASPTYVKSLYSQKYEIMAPPSISDIEAEFKEKNKGYYKLLVVTGCSYEGFVMDIKRLKKLCDEYETELFVDEAWYGYSNFHPLFQPTSATRNGVQYVTQSAHKMLSALRQSAFIHVNANASLDMAFFKDIYNTFTSTSPQYQLIASMDVAAMQMRMEGFELISQALERAEMFREDFHDQSFEKIRIVGEMDLKQEFRSIGYDMEGEGIFLDPLKISFDISELEINAKDAFDYIRKNAQVDLIKHTKNCIQILFTIGTAFDRNKAATLITTLYSLEQDCIAGKLPKVPIEKRKETMVPKINNLGYKDKSPREFFYGKRTAKKINEASGLTSATLVTPYPPGIPLILPGETISDKHVEYLLEVIDLGHISIHGLENNKIYVVDE
ncbi:aminotransferase class I/II-fold pyridoxal phosphate-dependent enzyme [Flavivirga spongiicola]|uniref:Aminotransferase class I/II-fold pyridoxal phosphate-dependent enzyme n=1 Tax=Flavivirga spongiicola TaxID=421621 RepID=A0ABU7Y0X0_9FLAO|nr:aminotransferase class I/II-fold pyridoxal phosphate-dependent enzyme [Flavivirga sp. MEBiC05379]MDO5980911.1 aminotransferase class I/II-fold pyridoxal phosphate-dependent enzyme [Flavivirga sp. MEBiC05379]